MVYGAYGWADVKYVLMNSPGEENRPHVPKVYSHVSLFHHEIRCEYLLIVCWRYMYVLLDAV
jgi:hypothetical protein